MDKIIIKNHTESISYHNDIYFFEEETINLLDKRYKNLLSKKNA